MNERGVTLVELIVVMSVTIILVVALAFSYQGWQGRYKVESQTKTLYTDLLDARSEAVQRAATYLLDFPTATSYRVGNDANGNGTIEESEVLATFPTDPTTGNKFKRVDYNITGRVFLMFDPRGLIYFSPLPGPPPAPPWTLIGATSPRQISLTSTSDPDYDCVMIWPTRISSGKMTAGVCNVK